MQHRKVMLITGARKGIGRYLAEYYNAKGFAVEGCSREPSRWRHDDYHHHAVDVTDEAQVRGMLSSIRNRHERLDVTINNAGIASMNHSLLMPMSTVEKIMNVNVNGTFLVSRESAKLMKKGRFGRIVNLSTVAVPMCLEGEAVYAASKSAVVTLTKVLARELAEFGITCNAVGPSPVETDLIRGVPGDKIDEILNRLPIKRMGRFEDISNVIDFFIRPESDYVTGQIIYLGGV